MCLSLTFSKDLGYFRIRQHQNMTVINPSKTLSQALRKFKPLRKDINDFKTKLSDCLNNIAIAEENKEHEENFKKYIADFLKNSLYQDHLINTKERIDLAIYSGKDANSPISVLIEVKRPSNTNEFLSPNNLNKKAFHELLLYYLKERVDKQNNNIKHLIATNGYEWYLFKGEDFYTYFYKNVRLKKEYEAFRDGEKDSSKNELFYNEIATKYIEEVGENLNYVYFNVKDYEPYLSLENKKDSKLVSLYKTLSSTHLLNKAFGNDSNQLNKAFYGELLHLIGLEEVKDKGKKVIQRLPKEKREYGSLLESTILALDDKDHLRKVPNLKTYGTTKEDQLFNVGLELCLTWINRILFIKLLESQLLGYHDNDKNYRFLNQEFIKGFDDLEALFFSALAKKQSIRHEHYKDKYQYVPYLNSSLFEAKDDSLEGKVMRLSNVKDEKINLYNKTVLKDGNNKRLTGEKNILYYLFEFLEAYDFSNDGKAQIEEGEQSKGLINASVLGLIFEKINGYKDGSFYTPSYITMYMSRETLRRAVVQKMNTYYSWKCTDFEDLKEDLRDYIKEQGKERNKARLQANKVINSLKICDPAVGSGHFLVSCLNELISIKSDLKILCDDKGERLDTYISLENDELIIEDENGEFFSYVPSIERTHQTQKALFHEKQTLIENCLFAVDINPNSVKICRLRLWIELLKNAYYNKDQVLQTLPNIDINIKCGNSLISRFGLEDDLKAAFKSKENPYSLKDYKNAVKEYKQTNDKARKREVQTIIDTIKNAFKDTLDKAFKKTLANAKANLTETETEINTLKQWGNKIPTKLKKLSVSRKLRYEKIKAQKEEIIDNVIYQDAFEWRFEFPEVLDNKGAFLGFDIIIGNPPYIRHELLKYYSKYLSSNYNVFTGKSDLYVYFFEKGINVLKNNGQLSFITSGKFFEANYGKTLITHLIQNLSFKNIIDFGDIEVFEGVSAYPLILEAKKEINTNYEFTHTKINQLEIQNTKLTFPKPNCIKIVDFKENDYKFISNTISKLINKVNESSNYLETMNLLPLVGLKTGYNDGFLIDSSYVDKYIKPHIFGKNIKKYNLPISFKSIIFPYDKKQDEYKLNTNITSSSVLNHLNTHKGKLSKRAVIKDGIIKGTKNWFEYQQINKNLDFDKEYIVYPNISLGNNFTLSKGNTIDITAFIIPSNDKSLLAILNSKLVDFLMQISAISRRGGYLEYKIQYLKKIPIRSFNKKTKIKVISLVDIIFNTKKENPNANTTELEQEIDVLVYQLYGLTYEEVLIVDSTFHLSKTEYENLLLE